MPIIVCPLSRASELARTRRPSRVVSLLDPGTPFPPLEGYADAQRLQLSVHDIETEMDGLDHPDETHMRQIIEFVSAWDRTAPILIHCFAGISRSTATAYITACAHNPDVDETLIALALRDVSPTASPNRRFVALADAALGRGGRMSSAIDAIGRGATWLEFGEAHPFTLPSRFAA
ncbi:MAG TPA: protein-tyrosine phosphatase family protein [Caulobacterales bacterium]|nr:protein-tyrosine phosphatase family protein [Caulobacterales bacterium]